MVDWLLIFAQKPTLWRMEAVSFEGDLGQMALRLAEIDSRRIERGFLYAELAYLTMKRLASADPRPDPSRGSDKPRAGRVASASARNFLATVLFQRSKAAKKNSSRFQNALEKADAARDGKDFSVAAEQYRIALDEQPNTAAIWVQYGNMLKETGDCEAATKAYLRSLELAGDIADTNLQLGHARKLVRDLHGALDAYSRAFQLDPTLEHIQREMDSVAFALDRSSLNGEQAELLIAADQARDQRDWRSAAEHYALLLRGAPHLGAIWVQYGHALKEVGHLKSAARAYRNSIEIRPTAAEPYLQLGHVLKIMGDLSNARKAYSRALDLHPGSASALSEVTALGASESAARFEIFAAEEHAYDFFDIDVLSPSDHARSDGRDAALTRSVAETAVTAASEPAPHSAEESKPQAASKEPKSWFFLGDTIDWLQAHEQVTGVGRVTVELFFASLREAAASRMLPCALAQTSSGLASISLRDSVSYLASRVGTHAASQLLEPLENLATIPPATAFSPVRGDHVLFTGVIWNPNYVALFRNLAGRGIRFSVLVYDIIPIENPEFVSEPHRRMFTEWLETTIGLASVVFVSSPTIRDQILRWAALSALHVNATIIPVEFGSSEHKRPLSAEQLVENPATSRVRLNSFVLSVGTIDSRKNQALLCRVWGRLRSDLGRSKAPQLVLVGRDDVQLASMSAEIRSAMKASDIVVMEGLGDAELAGLYHNCLLTAFPSLSEGYGLPVSESLGYGKLCVSSDLPVIREHAGDLPWYFKPGDEDAAYAMLRRAIKNTAARSAAETRITREFRPKAWDATYQSIARSGEQWFDFGKPQPFRLASRRRPNIPGIAAASIPAALTAAQEWCTERAPDVSILIINWNASQLTLECLRHIWANTAGVRYEVIIVDNGSDPGELTALHSLGCGVRLLALGVNRYFGEANNIAAEHARGRYVCLLNNDAFVQTGWLRHLVACLENNPDAGASGPLFLFPDGKIQEAGASVDAGGYPIRHGRGGALKDPHGFLVSKNVDYISAATLLMTRDLFMEAGGFDLAYEPAYYEDVDLCFKIRALGRKVRFCPDARVVHVEGSSANNNPVAEARRNALGDLNRDKFTSRWGSYLRDRSDAGLRIVAERTLAGSYQRAPGTQKTAVLYTPYALTPGGGERYLLTIASALTDDHLVTIVTPHPYSRLRLLNLGREFGLDLSSCRVMTHSEFLDTRNPDLMIVMGNHIVPPIPARVDNSVFLCQFPFPFPFPQAAVKEARVAMGSYRAVVTYSEYAKTHVFAGLSAYQMPIRPIEVVYPPVPQLAGAADHKKNIILSVGRFFAGGHNKRHDLVITAFRTLLERVDGDFELHLVGSSIPDPEHMDYLNRLKDMAKGFPIFFHVNASQETLSDLYRDAAVYWHATGLGADLSQEPGLAEHFGISIVEAMSAECVCMAFSSGGPREIITHGVNGFLYSSLEELVETTSDLFTVGSTTMRNAVGRQAGRKAVDFSPEAFAHKIRALMRI